MYLKNFQYSGIRNLYPGKIELGEGLNIFFGENGAGKSSVLEAISLLTSGRSFRSRHLERVLANTDEEFVIFGMTDEKTRIGIGFHRQNKKKTIKLDGEIAHNLSSLSRLYPTQVLSPESYHLIDSGPGERRKFLDWCLFHVEHSFHAEWKKYSAIVKQRNALLKSVSQSVFEEEIDVWDEQLCASATRITQFRERILLNIKSVFDELSVPLNLDFCEGLSFNYYPGYTGSLSDKLNTSRASDRESGFTKFGPHKADIRIKIDGHPAKEFLSRGQKKVLINALFLSQTQLLKRKLQKESLFVIDDFSSELDEHNQRALLDTLLGQDDVQIILSCLQLESLNWLKKGYNMTHMFHVEQGKITPVNSPDLNNI